MEFLYCKKIGITEPLLDITFPYLKTEKDVLASPAILFALINSLSEASFVAPYKLIGELALSVLNAKTFFTLFFKLPNIIFSAPPMLVFIVSIDALEPIILSLKKIEEYEFADKLSPDERDDICRVIGTFAHSAKRRVQIDQWFNERILSDIEKAGKLLPPEYVKQVQQYDIAEKLNPPQEKRNKRIELSELKESNLNFKQEMHNKFKILDKNIPEIETKITEKPN